MGDLSTVDELIQVVEKLMSGKAESSSGILLEKLKAAYCDSKFHDLLLSLVLQAWKDRKVPK